MKLQVERDQLAEAVAWTARALPTRPTAPVLAGMRLHAGSELILSTFDYEVSAQATVPVITDEEGTVLVSGRLLAEIVRSLPGQARRAGHRRHPRHPQVRQRDLHPGPAARGGVPDAAGDAAAGRLGGQRRPGHRDQPGGHRSGPGRHLARADRGSGSRSPATRLPWSPPTGTGWRSASCAGTRPGRTCPPPCSFPLAYSATRHARSPPVPRWPSRSAARASSASPGRAGRPPPGCCPASTPSTPRCCPASSARRRSWRPTRSPRRSSGSRWSPIAIPRCGWLSAPASSSSRPARLRRPRRPRSLEAAFDGEDLQIAFNPQYLLDGIGAIGSDTARISFTSATKPAVITGKTEREPDYRYVLMPIRSGV